MAVVLLMGQPLCFTRNLGNHPTGWSSAWMILIKWAVAGSHTGMVAAFAILNPKANSMDTIQQPLTHAAHNHKTGIFARFGQWLETQNKNRIAWLAIALAGHGCVLTPITIFSIMMAGNNFIYWPLAMGAMAICLVVNLAAMPTRITIPVFFLSVLVDLVVIANCIAAGLHFV